MLFSAYVYLLALAVPLLSVLWRYYYGFGSKSLAGLRG